MERIVATSGPPAAGHPSAGFRPPRFPRSSGSASTSWSSARVWKTRFAALAVSTAAFISVIIKRREDWSLTCVSASAVVAVTWEVVSRVAHRDGWPASDLWVIGMTGACLRVAAIIVLAVSMMADVRSGRLSWPPWRPTPDSGTDPA